MTSHSPSPDKGEQKQSLGTSHPFSAENKDEVARLLLQHRRLSELMGGVLPSSLDLSHVQSVLDVGCGTGGWVYDMGWRYPDMKILGIDKSAYFIEQAQALLRGGVTNVTCMVQDMFHLEGEAFIAGAFDLIHLRFLAETATPQTFPLLIHSLVRLCKAGGFLVWTEAELPITNSPACQQLCAMMLRGLQAARRAFSPGNALGIVVLMSRWLRDAGCQIAQDRAYAIDVSAGAKGHEMFVRQAEVFGHQVRPFVLKSGVTTETKFDDVFLRMQQEIQEEAFCGVCFLRMLVGVKVV